MLTNGGGVGLGGTVDTLSIEKDNDWALVGTYNKVIGGKKLNILRAVGGAREAEARPAAVPGNR